PGNGQYHSIDLAAGETWPVNGYNSNGTKVVQPADGWDSYFVLPSGQSLTFTNSSLASYSSLGFAQDIGLQGVNGASDYYIIASADASNQAQFEKDAAYIDLTSFILDYGNGPAGSNFGHLKN